MGLTYGSLTGSIIPDFIEVIALRTDEIQLAWVPSTDCPHRGNKDGFLWGVTGGASLIKLDPQTGEIIKEYGDSITTGLAINSSDNLIYVASGNGIEVFNSETEEFTHYSDIRVDNLAINPLDKTLWATTYPKRGNVISFSEDGKATLMVEYDSPIDSIAFGETGTQLENIIFVSDNSGKLHMVDTASLESITIASGGSRGEIVETTPDGKVLVAQSNQIDIFNPVLSPNVKAINPAPGSTVALPQGKISITFDTDMLEGDIHDENSVFNPNNYQLIDIAGNIINPLSVRYDNISRTALLEFNGIDAGEHKISILPSLESSAGLKMESGYNAQFTAISNFSDKVEFKFDNPRSNRQNQTVSYDVTITNTSAIDLQLPLMLVLDPAQYFNGEVIGAVGQNRDGAFLVDLQDSLDNGTLKAGESITNRTITVFNPDAYRVELAPGIYTLPYPNAAPTITSNPIKIAIANTEYNYQILASDSDGVEFGYLLENAPQGMSVSENGLITWNPTENSAVNSKVEIYVFDKRGGYSKQEFIINVTGGNNKPVFNNLSVITGASITTQNNSFLINAKEAQTLQIQIAATDTDTDKLTYWADNLPPGAVFDAKTGILTWTPGNNSAGIYENVTFVVTDGKERITQTATFLVEATNQLPTFKTIPSKIVREGESVRIQLFASDAEGDNLTYSSKLLPGGSKLDSSIGLFEWKPGFFQAGEFKIPFIVSDGESIVTQTAKITVLNANAAPVFEDIGKWYVQEGEQLRFRAFAYDADNPDFVPQEKNADGDLTLKEGSLPTVNYTVSNLPQGATFDKDTAIFSWKPDFEDFGIHKVTFMATDDGDGTGFNASTSITIPITVYNTNRAPEIAEFDNISLNKGETQEITIEVTDAESDKLRLSLVREREAGFGIPDFIDFVDNGDGKATLNISPSDKDISGSYTFTLIAEEIRDDNDNETPLYTEKTFNINVLGDNDAPQIEYIGDKVAVVGETLAFDVVVEDNNQDDLTFEIVNQQDLPSGISLTQKGGYGKASFEWVLATDEGVATDEDVATDEGVATNEDVATDEGILDKTYPVTIRVTDSGNGSSEIFSDIQTFNINVRNSNTAPQLKPIPNLSPEGILTVKEAEILELQLTATDSDNDEITYLAKNLPQNASLDAKTGLLIWKPDYSQAGIYENITIIATDGNKQSEKTFSIEVENTNRAPAIIPLPTQIARENEFLRFNLSAVDYDVEGVVFSPITNLPEGATFDSRTGEFVWKPSYNQSGQYKLTFEVSDAGGEVGKRDVDILITDSNRNPELKVSNRGVALGETLNFTLNGFDPDEKAQLTYSADILPEGATLNTETGTFIWTPNPGQVDDYSINFSVSDGISTVTENVLVKVALTAENPTVNLDLTPGFAVTPNQSVIVTAFADGFASIDDITVKVDGETKILDRFGRFEFIPTTAGKVFVEAIATDADGRVGRNSTVIKVRNPFDNEAPIVELDSAVNASRISEITDIVGEVSDVNLDSWKLEIASFGEDDYKAIAQGENTVNENILAQIDPNKLNNGFYQLRLTATDISGRTSTTETVVEINSTAKTSAYTRTETDLTYNFLDEGRRNGEVGRSNDGTSSLFPLPSSLFTFTRTYNSLDNTWRFSTDTNIQTNVALTGREELGVYEPYRVGTRLYLTTPTGERVGFTFTPQKQEISGLTYYSPQWVADAGVEFTLNSVDANLTLAGNRFYELNTGFAYNPASGDFDGAEFTLTAADGTQYLIDSEKGITEQIADGISLVYSDSGITSSTGQTVQFVNDEQGFLKEIIAPDGTKVVYDYQDGNLVAARNLSTGKVQRYGYTSEGRRKKEEGRSDSTTYLTLVSGNPGSGGESITYNKVPQITDTQRDLGGVVGWNGYKVEDNSTGEIEQYTFGLRKGEIESTATGIVLVSAEVTGGGLPSVAGLIPVATDGSYALFAIDNPGLNLISLSSAPQPLSTSALPTLTLRVAGDLDGNGTVDGVDSAELATAIAKGNYDVRYDFNRDNVVNAADMHILGSNYGFAANIAPRVTPTTVLTHTDLQAFIELDTIATDPEGDPIYFRLANPEQGSVSFTPDGKSVRFTPEDGYSGVGSFDLIADDGFSTAAPVTIRVNVSDAPLINLDIVNRSPRLDKGESTQLVAIGDFSDQEDVILPASYVTFGSEKGLVADINEYGVLSGVSDGVEIVSVRKNGISAVTAVRVGDIPAPSNEDQFYVALAEQDGLQLYPEAVTLTTGMTRQLLVGLDESFSPSLTTADATSYYVSNSKVLEIDENGLITTKDEGVANVTIFHGAAEEVVPIRVLTPPEVGSRVLGEEGGIVQASDGSLVMVPPDTLAEGTTVSYTKLEQSDISLEIPTSEDLPFVGAFNLDFGDTALDEAVQLAIPNTTGLEVGTEVVFMREGFIPNENGGWDEGWLIEEVGIVGSDNMIRTQSPPFPGVKRSGNYVMQASLKYSFTKTKYELEADFDPFSTLVGVGVGLGVTASYAKISLGTLLGKIAIGAIAKIGATPLLVGAAIGLATAYALSLKVKKKTATIDIFQVPPVGLPQKTEIGVEINTSGVPVVKSVVQAPSPATEADPSFPAVIESAEFKFKDIDDDGLEDSVVLLTGSNLLNGTDDLGDRFEDLEIEFKVGNNTFTAPVEFGTSLGENRQEIYVKPPQTVVMSEAAISIIRPQKVRTGSDPSDYEIVELKSERPAYLELPDTEYALISRRWANRVDVVDLIDTQKIVDNTGSMDLLSASIPVGTKPEGIQDLLGGPREAAATNDAGRAYVILDRGQVAVIDLMALRQVDNNPSSYEVEPIFLLPGVFPNSIVIEPTNRYAYIADGSPNGKIYVLDINPFSNSYNEIIESIQVDAPNGLKKLTISTDGRKLYGTAPGSGENGNIVVVNIDPEDKPQDNISNNRKWHKQIAVIVTDGARLEGIDTGNNANQIVFTQRKNETKSVGVITVTEDDPLQFEYKVKYIATHLSSQITGRQNDFEINDAKRTVITNDGKYGFVLTHNSYQKNRGFELIPNLPLGTSIGIIENPLEANAKLIAATRPIPMGLGADIQLSGDDKFLTGTYPGVDGVFVFDVEEIRRTLDVLKSGNKDEEFKIDRLTESGPNYKDLQHPDIRYKEDSIFRIKPTRFSDLLIVPIDDVNPDINIAGRFEIVEATKRGDNEYIKYGVPEEFGVPISNAPVGLTGIPWSVDIVSKKDWIDLNIPDSNDEFDREQPAPFIDALNPRFSWKFDKNVTKNPNNIEEVYLYISVFDHRNGLVPGDWTPKEENIPSRNDYNPNRILTATWTPKKGAKGGGIWRWNGGSEEGSNNEFTLPASRMLTAGQIYYWAVDAKVKNRKLNQSLEPRFGQFRTSYPKIDNLEQYSSVTFITGGLEPVDETKSNDIIAQIDEIGKYISTKGKKTKYSLMKYNWQTHEWVVSQNDKAPQKGEPLVLLPDWTSLYEVKENQFDSAEAAADVLFASLVKLNKDTGNRLFNSSTHFIGFGQGAVVNSEIVQRLGTYFPKGKEEHKNKFPDLHMTTIDPFSYGFTSLEDEKLQYHIDPQVKVWENVTYADNYYQTTAADTNIKSNRLDDADYNLQLDNKAGFGGRNQEKNDHKLALEWYMGTVNVNIDVSGPFNNKQPGQPKQPIYRRLGDLDKDNFTPPEHWYTPKHRNADFSNNDGDAPWEGIGTGWFYSELGGGSTVRLDDESLLKRTKLYEDNQTLERMRGDYAVPTLFNGNFDAISENIAYTHTIPGWSLEGEPKEFKKNNAFQKHLVTWEQIGQQSNKFKEHLRKIRYDSTQPNYALKLGGDGAIAITHNYFMLPEWGDLRFNLHVGGNLNPSAKLQVRIRDEQGNLVKETISLERASGEIDKYSDDKKKIGYGINGFETFRVNISKDKRKLLQNQRVTLNFELEGQGTPVYLDDIFFKSDDLRFGNPTNARHDVENNQTNFLIEKAQYTVSYNSQVKYKGEKDTYRTNTPNWVSWRMNESWLGGDLSRPKFDKDSDIDQYGWFLPDNNNYDPKQTDLNIIEPIRKESVLEPGHLVAAADRRRNRKDFVATFLTTNIFPHDKLSNNTAWKALERFLRDGSKQDNGGAKYGYDYYIIAGVHGTNEDLKNTQGGIKEYIELDGNTDPTKRINIPSHVWKVVVELPKVGASIEDASNAFAVYMPNQNITGQKWNKREDKLFMSIRQLETILNSNKGERNFDYRFLGEVKDDELRNNLLDKNTNNLLGVPLLADSNLTFLKNTLQEASVTPNTSIWHNSVVENSSFKTSAFRTFEVGITEPNTLQIAVNPGPPQISIAQVRPFQMAVSQVGSLQLSSNEIAITEASFPQRSPIQLNSLQISTIQDRPIEKSTTQKSITQISTNQGNLTQASSSQIDSSQIDAIKNLIFFNPDTSKIFFPSSNSSTQFFSSDLHTTSSILTNTFKDNPLNLTLQVTDLPTGQLAEAQVTEFTDQGIPNGGTILIDHNANGLGWFIDPTPFDHSEFSHTLTDTALLATADSEAHGKYDLLTTILHELGHLAGFISGYNEFDRHIQTINGKKTFVAEDFTATLSPDGSHLDSEAHPYDLMNTTLRPGVRKLPSLLNLQILNALRSEGVSEGVSEGLLTAPLTSTPLFGINNGTFDTQDIWSTRGAANIIEGQAILTEESRLNSSFTQNFIIPEEAKYLQFTILESDLEGRRKEEEGRNNDSTSSVFPLPSSLSNAPGDAFEVALLNNQNLSLAGTAAGLTHTDALLNIQHDGDAYFSDKVNISGAETSGNQIDLNVTRTVTIDISHINANTEATLYFDLLGFGDKESRVVIDNVRILTDDILIPTANNDTAITNQGKPVTINVLDNDTDPDGTINPSTIQIESAPVNGNITINDDGTITYNPSGNATADTFTYTVKDNDNNTSNTATVNITINNSAPSIREIIVEPNLAEGIAATFSANATDEGEITYSWNFGDNTPTLNGQSVTHTFLDNGTYTATLTVTDSNGASTVETLTLDVNNIAPTVTAGEDQTTIENQSITFNGSYTDPGILDTHSIRWEFGDGSVLVSEGVREGLSEGVNYLNPTHTYVNPGVYTATLTVTDKDGGTSSDTLQVQVNNAAPTITEITGDTNLEEGAIANFNAIATSHDDTLFRLANQNKKYAPVIEQLFDISYITQQTVRELIKQQRKPKPFKIDKPSIWRRTRDGRRYCQVPPIYDQETGVILQKLMDSTGKTAQELLGEALRLELAFFEGRLVEVARNEETEVSSVNNESSENELENNSQQFIEIDSLENDVDKSVFSDDIIFNPTTTQETVEFLSNELKAVVETFNYSGGKKVEEAEKLIAQIIDYCNIQPIEEQWNTLALITCRNIKALTVVIENYGNEYKDWLLNLPRLLAKAVLENPEELDWVDKRLRDEALLIISNTTAFSVNSLNI